MSTEPVTTTGTDPKDGGKSLEQPVSPGTPEVDNRNAKPGDEDWKALAVSLQEKAARVNELEDRLREIESVRPQSPAVAPDDTDRGVQELMAQLEAAAQAGDPASKAQLWLMEQREMDRRELSAELELSRMSTDEAEAVREHVKKHPRAFNSVKAARNDLRATKLETENETLRRENERLKQKPSDDVLHAPPTNGRETTARGTNIYDQARWNKEMQDLNQRLDDGDKKAMEEKVRLQAQRRSGSLPWRQE